MADLGQKPVFMFRRCLSRLSWLCFLFLLRCTPHHRDGLTVFLIIWATVLDSFPFCMIYRICIMKCSHVPSFLFDDSDNMMLVGARFFGLIQSACVLPHSVDDGLPKIHTATPSGPLPLEREQSTSLYRRLDAPFPTFRSRRAGSEAAKTLRGGGSHTFIVFLVTVFATILPEKASSPPVASGIFSNLQWYASWFVHLFLSLSFTCTVRCTWRWYLEATRVG